MARFDLGSLIRCTLATLATWILFLSVSAFGRNPVQIENAKLGDPTWFQMNLATAQEIEGYASATSVNRGQSIKLFVSTIDPSYRMDVFRIGWYGGAGARRMLPAIIRMGIHQPMPSVDPTTGLIECQWGNPYVMQIPNNRSDSTDWLSGIYLVRLTGLPSGKQNYIIFVVRDDWRPSDLLFQSSVTTYEAYNDWGGMSLYGNPRAHKVSFNRPYKYDAGTGDFFRWEINMIRFLEREGYDVSYSTNVDTHTRGSLLLLHKAFLSVGHDEYWSWQMRDNVEAARDSGVSLGFFSANVGYWQIRFESSRLTAAPNRTIVCYKNAKLDPYSTDGNPQHQHLVTVKFRDLPVNRPEDAMVGVMYVTELAASADIVITNSASWVFKNTGLTNGARLTGLLGYEADKLFKNIHPGIVILAHSPFRVNGTTYYSDMTTYRARSGSTVVATGSMNWSLGVDDFGVPWHPPLASSAVQQATRNILTKFGATLSTK